MKEFEIFNQDRSEYFRGTFNKRDRHNSTCWEIVCISAGGTLKVLQVMDLQHKRKGQLINVLKAYAKKHSLKIRNLDGKYRKSE